MIQEQTSPAIEQVQPRLLDIKAAAAYLSSTVWAVRNLIWDRRIPYVTLGKKQLLDRADLDAFIEQQKQRAGDAFYAAQEKKAAKKAMRPLRAARGIA